MTAKEIIEAKLYGAAVMLMDDEIREEVHARMVPCTALEFLEAYMIAHKEKNGAEFVV